MVGVWVDTCDIRLCLSGIYLFDSEDACRRWQYGHLVAAGYITEIDGLPFYRDEAMDSWQEALDTCRYDYIGSSSFFRIMDVQQGVAHAA